jgi:hypothetical protein
VPFSIKPDNNDNSDYFGDVFNMYSCEPPNCGVSAQEKNQVALLAKSKLLPKVLKYFNFGSVKLPQVVQQDPSLGLKVYCVGCGATGAVTVGGTVTYKVLSGITTASLNVKGNVKATLKIGVDAFANYEHTFSARIATVTLPGVGFKIVDIIEVGPEITLHAALDVEVSAEGQYAFGAVASLPNFAANIDFLNPSSSTASGWTPSFQLTGEAYGTLGTQVSLGLPLALSIGIDILDGKYNISAALVTTLALTAKAAYEGSFNIDSGTCSTTSGSDQCQGIAWHADVGNTIEITFGTYS